MSDYTTAIRQAAEEIADRMGLITFGQIEETRNIIYRHLAPLLEQAEKERDDLAGTMKWLKTEIEIYKGRLRGVPHELDNGMRDEGEHDVAALLAKLAAVEADRDAAWTALGECTCLMDPPDGGSPTLAELVGRMRSAWKQAEDRAAAAEGECAKFQNNMERAEEGEAEALAKLAEVEADRDMLRGLYRGAAADLASALTRAEQSEALLREAQNHLDEPAILGPNSLDGRISAHLAPKETT